MNAWAERRRDATSSRARGVVCFCLTVGNVCMGSWFGSRVSDDGTLLPPATFSLCDRPMIDWLIDSINPHDYSIDRSASIRLALGVAPIVVLAPAGLDYGLASLPQASSACLCVPVSCDPSDWNELMDEGSDHFDRATGGPRAPKTSAVDGGGVKHAMRRQEADQAAVIFFLTVINSFRYLVLFASCSSFMSCDHAVNQVFHAQHSLPISQATLGLGEYHSPLM